MRRLAGILAAAAAAICAGAALFAHAARVPFTTGLWWAIVTATTVGYGDVVPRTTAGRLIGTAVMLTAIPLLGAAFAHATALHLRRHTNPDAAAALRIAADLYRHHTGRDHPDAPRQEGNR